MKIAFFGTSIFGAKTLRLLINKQDINVNFIFTALPRKAKRGQKIQKTVIHEIAESAGYICEQNLFTLDSLGDDVSELLLENKIDIGIVVSYGLLIPENVLNSATHGFINIHPSKLPRWRGAAPIERAIEAGDSQTAVEIIKMTKKLDDGAIVARRILPLDGCASATEMHEKFSDIGASMIEEVLLDTLKSRSLLVLEEQSGEVKYARKIRKEELCISLLTLESCSAEEIERKIRAFDSCGICYVFFGEKRLKIKLATVSEVEPKGIEFFSNPCKGGKFIIPVDVIPEGKKLMKFEDFLRGYQAS